MKIQLLVLLLASSFLAAAQTPDQAQSLSETGPTILSRSELDVPPEVATGKAGDYFNFLAYGDYTYNSYLPYTGAATSGLSGWDAGIGLNLLHYFHTGTLTLNYTGGYRGYSGMGGDPTNNIIQNLTLGFNKQLSRHVMFSFHQVAGLNPGGWIPQQVATPTTALGLNLIATRTETLSTTVALTIQQTRRLSWVLGGDFFYLRYKPDNQIGSAGEDGSFGVNYRITKKATLGATAAYQHYGFMQSQGTSDTQSIYGSLSYLFSERLQAGISAGGQRSTYDSLSGQIIGSSLVITSGQHAHYSPFFSGRLAMVRKRTTLSLLGGETAGGGNGLYLASNMIYVSGSAAYVATRAWSLSAGGGFQRISSLAGGPATPSEFVMGGSDYKLTRHIGIRASLNWAKFSTVGTYQGNSYYNATIGIIFTTADRPVASLF